MSWLGNSRLCIAFKGIGSLDFDLSETYHTHDLFYITVEQDKGQLLVDLHPKQGELVLTSCKLELARSEVWTALAMQPLAIPGYLTAEQFKQADRPGLREQVLRKLKQQAYQYGRSWARIKVQTSNLVKAEFLSCDESLGLTCFSVSEKGNLLAEKQLKQAQIRHSSCLYKLRQVTKECQGTSAQQENNDSLQQAPTLLISSDLLADQTHLTTYFESALFNELHQPSIELKDVYLLDDFSHNHPKLLQVAAFAKTCLTRGVSLQLHVAIANRYSKEITPKQASFFSVGAAKQVSIIDFTQDGAFGEAEQNLRALVQLGAAEIMLHDLANLLQIPPNDTTTTGKNFTRFVQLKNMLGGQQTWSCAGVATPYASLLGATATDGSQDTKISFATSSVERLMNQRFRAAQRIANPRRIGLDAWPNTFADWCQLEAKIHAASSAQ